MFKFCPIASMVLSLLEPIHRAVRPKQLAYLFMGILVVGLFGLMSWAIMLVPSFGISVLLALYFGWELFALMLVMLIRFYVKW